MPGLFEFLDAINTGKVVQLDESAADPFKEYVPFQINNGLSQNIDTVMLANEMNKRPWLTKEMQFKFLDGAVSKKKRYGKWAKAEGDADKESVESLAEYYQVSRTRAAEYLKLVPPEGIAQIQKFLNKGGTDYKPRTKK